MQTLKMFRPRKKIILLIVVIFFFVVIGAANIYSQFRYARELEITGVVVEIQWKTDNHQLSKIVILDEAGKRIAISQFTIALNPSTVKVGDRIVKKKESEFCTINGGKIRFSLY